jgi:hypothetical protein
LYVILLGRAYCQIQICFENRQETPSREEGSGDGIDSVDWTYPPSGAIPLGDQASALTPESFGPNSMFASSAAKIDKVPSAQRPPYLCRAYPDRKSTARSLHAALDSSASRPQIFPSNTVFCRTLAESRALLPFLRVRQWKSQVVVDVTCWRASRMRLEVE